MLTDQEVNDILFDVNTMDVSEMVREIYKKGYDKAIADAHNIENRK